MIKLALCLLLSLLLLNGSTGQTLDLGYRLIIEDIQVPWGMDWLPNGDMLVADRGGALYRWRESQLEEIDNVPEVVVKSQGGLMDIKVHPNYANNGWIYFSYSKKVGSDATTAIFRAKLNGNNLADIQEVFRAEPAFETRHHYGSRIVFDGEGHIFLSVGDRGKRDQNPQSLDNHCGKIHRINDDGSVPSDNPFINDPTAMPTIWSYGHRNPQGLVYDPATDRLWEHEHGPKGGDELNLIQKGANYGWPVISYGINYNGTKFTEITQKEGMEQPEVYWVPSIAPSGLELISTNRYSGLKGDLLAGSLSFQYLHRIDLEDGKVIKQEEYFKDIGRVRVVRQGPDGFVYFGVENKGIFRLVQED